ncbi:MAG: phytanoyl-CoA dioxygenase [Nitrospirales bacterium]|nr:phytanoyl-CoA dioxygenase [Nitrospirales bacterium]
MVDPKLISQFETDGVCVVKRVLDDEQLYWLKLELNQAREEDLRQRPDVLDSGMVHNCMLRGKEMAKLLDNPTMNAYVKEVLSPTFILYAYQSSSLPSGGGNYGSRVHVDCFRFIPNYITNVGVFFALDDFTLENGATYYLKGSHKKKFVLDEKKFYENASRLICQAGDMVVLNALLHHAAGVNKTNKIRHALTMNFCRCYMRQRFDFCRMVDKEFIESLGEDGKRLMGWNVRVPTSLDEFYLPEEERLYKPGQE